MLGSSAGASFALGLAAMGLTVSVLCMVIDVGGLRWVLGSAVGTAAVTVLFTAWRTDNLWSLVMGCVVLLAAWQCGEWILRGAGMGSLGAGRGLISLAVGASVLALATYLLALTVGVHWWSVGVVALALGAVGATTLVTRTRLLVERSSLPMLGRGETASLAMLALTWGFASVWTAAPEIQYDPLWAKAFFPDRWAQTGAVSFDPRLIESYATGNSLFLGLPGYTLGAPSVGRYMALALGLLLALAAWRFTRGVAGGFVGGMLALAWVLAPQVFWQMTTANDDLTLALLAGGLALAVILVPRGGFFPGLVMGIAAAGAINGKVHLAPFALVMLAGWLCIRAARPRLRSLVGAATGLVVIAGVPIVLRWVDVGNPVYPALNNIFRSQYWPDVNFKFNFPYETSGSLASALRAPWDFVADPTKYMEMVPRGAFGLLVAILLVFALLGWSGTSSRVRVIWIATLAALVGWWFALRYLRYLLPYAYVSVLMAGMLLAVGSQARIARSWWLRLRRLAPLAVALVVFAAAGPIIGAFWNIPERVPLKVATGREPADAYRQRVIGGWDAYKVINTLTGPSSWVVADVGRIYDRTALAGARMIIPTWSLAFRTNWENERAGRPSDDRGTWSREGIRWLLVADDLARSGQYGLLVQSAVVGYAQPRWSDGGLTLYEIPGVDDR